METTTDTITLFDGKNSQLQNTIFQHSHHVSYAFFPGMNKSLHGMLIKIYINICPDHGLSFTPPLKHSTNPSLHSHPLFGLHKHSKASVNISGCHFLRTEESSSSPLLHMHFHVRHHSVRLPLCCHLLHSNNM